MPKPPMDIFPLGEESCYGATFTGKDMKPGQKLTEFYTYSLHAPHPELERIELSRDEAQARERENISEWASSPIRIFARFKDNKHTYYQYAGCSVFDQKTGIATCGVDCDGGAFNAKRSDKGFDLFFRDTEGIRLIDSCDGPGEFDLPGRYMTKDEAGGGFTMAKLPLSACQKADRDLYDVLYKEKTSLRERIETKGWRCLKRSYDKAHLARHPQQQVTDMTVAIKGPVRVEMSEGWPFTTLDVSVSFRLRDGTTVARDVSCSAEDLTFQCEGNVWLQRRDETSALLLAGPYDDLATSHAVLDTELGKDDVTFRLDASTEEDCSVE
jgi:hypothetical protein